jgi:hypothetical protein
MQERICFATLVVLLTTEFIRRGHPSGFRKSSGSYSFTREDEGF